MLDPESLLREAWSDLEDLRRQAKTLGKRLASLSLDAAELGQSVADMQRHLTLTITAVQRLGPPGPSDTPADPVHGFELPGTDPEQN